jgi:UDP:flavonoid glycosyltransferase YjiC (YdhE family)
MKIVLASYGTRGDIEPCVAIGRELQRRGHEVRMAVPPDLIEFTAAAGLSAVAYGPDLQGVLDAHRNFWTHFFRNFWKVRELIRLRREVVGPFLPAPLGRRAMKVGEWVAWRAARRVEGVQRGELGLPKATRPSPWRITERGWLEIQAYDEVCFPGLAAEWASGADQRPFVGALTMELATAADDEVASWIAAGTPPIFFGFGSLPVGSADDTLAMISAACARLGERALICAAGTDFRIPHSENIKVVGAMNYAAAFPACRAVVHHGGLGTTAAGLRAGVPTLILSTDLDQTLWGSRVKRLKVGTARRFSATTEKTLVADLSMILDPGYVARAREIAAQMTKPDGSVATAADLVEMAGRSPR